MNRVPGPPNAVYQRARAGLAGIVSGRAAQRVLDSAMGRRSRTPDAVSADEMVDLLTGPVYRDLATVLPREGLRLELKRLVRALRSLPYAPASEPGEPAAPAQEEAPVASEPVAPLEVLADADATTETDALTPSVADADAPLGAPAADPNATLAPATDAAPQAAATDVAPQAAPPIATALADVRRPSLDADRVLPSLALLEGVDGAAVFGPSGRVESARGDLPDVEALGRVLMAAGGLLGRHGSVRSVNVTTTRGALVALPLASGWLAVSGPADVNLGAVYAALAASEEER